MVTDCSGTNRNYTTWGTFISLVLLIYFQSMLSEFVQMAILSKSILESIVSLCILISCIYYSIRRCFTIQESICGLPKRNISVVQICIIIGAFIILLLIKCYGVKYGPINKHGQIFTAILEDSYFPILEEYAYRGALILLLSRKLKKAWQIAIVSSTVFAIAHFDLNIYHIINFFIWGYLLFYTFYYTRSLLPGIFMHILGNASIDILPMIIL